MPLTATSSAVTCSSESSFSFASSSEPSSDVLRQRAQEAHLRVRQAGRRAHLLGVGRQHLVRRRRVAAEVGEEPLVDRARRLGRELLADDRAHERAVVVVRVAGRAARRARPVPRRPRCRSISSRSTGSASRRCAMAPSGMGFERARVRRSGSSGRPRPAGHAGVGRVLGLDLRVRADVVDRLGDGDRRLGEAGGDQLELAVEGRDVAARPHGVEVGLHHRVDDDRALGDLQAPVLERPERGLEPELEQDRVASRARPRRPRPRSGTARRARSGRCRPRP